MRVQEVELCPKLLVKASTIEVKLLTWLESLSLAASRVLITY